MEEILPCAFDGCKNPSMMPDSEYCLVHGRLDFEKRRSHTDAERFRWLLETQPLILVQISWCSDAARRYEGTDVRESIDLAMDDPKAGRWPR